MGLRVYLEEYVMFGIRRSWEGGSWSTWFIGHCRLADRPVKGYLLQPLEIGSFVSTKERAQQVCTDLMPSWWAVQVSCSSHTWRMYAYIRTYARSSQWWALILQPVQNWNSYSENLICIRSIMFFFLPVLISCIDTNSKGDEGKLEILEKNWNEFLMKNIFTHPNQ